MNVNLTDTVTLGALFDQVDAWNNLPLNSLSEQQIALINLKNCFANSSVASKNGGAAAMCCFICVTGA